MDIETVLMPINCNAELKKLFMSNCLHIAARAVFFLLKHFGHLSYNIIKTHRKTIH